MSMGTLLFDTVETYFGSNLGTKVVLEDSTESTISYNVSLYNNSSERYVFVGVSEPAIYDNDDIVYGSGVAKYVFSVYIAKVIVYDVAGNSSTSEVIEFTALELWVTGASSTEMD